MSHAEREAAGGRALQEAAAAAVAGRAPACGDRVTWYGVRYVCVCPPHQGPQPSVDQWRRTHGQSVHADRHYYVEVDA